MTAIASRMSPSRPTTPSFFNFGTPPLSVSLRSPSLHQSYSNAIKIEDMSENRSPRIRASSDPPPSSHGGLKGAGSEHLALEPNPFEQSFSASSIPASMTRSTANENQPTDTKVTVTRRARSQSPPSSLLAKQQPPVSALASPSILGGDGSATWSMDHIFRSGGSSSPALHRHGGPTPGFSAGFAASLFDPNSFKTGLTPGANISTSFAPPSPNTQAMFALMTNHVDTPNTAGQTTAGAKLGVPAIVPVPSLQEPNHFDLGFKDAMRPTAQQHEAQANQAKMQSNDTSMPAGFAQHTQAVPRPISFNPMMRNQNVHPNGHLAPNGAIHPAQLAGSTLNGVKPNPLYLFGDLQNGNGPPKNGSDQDEVMAAGVLSALNTGYSSDEINIGNNTPAIVQRSIPPSQLEGNFLPFGGNNAAKSAKPQQQQQLSQQQAQALSASQNSSQMNTRKRKAQTQPTAEEIALIDPDIPPPATRGRKKGSTNKKKAKQSVEEEPDGSQDGSTNNDVPQTFETEEEKRKNFLERNRQAALKCRQRKKAWLTSLQNKVELLTADNEALQGTIKQLRDEVGGLRSILIAHKDCAVPVAHGNSMVSIGAMLNGGNQYR